MDFQVGDLVEFEVNGAREAGVVLGKAPAGGLEIRGSFGVTHVLPRDTLRVVGREFAGRLGPARVRGLLRSILTVQIQRHIRNHKREKAYPPWGYDWNGDNYGDGGSSPHDRCEEAFKSMNATMQVNKAGGGCGRAYQYTGGPEAYDAIGSLRAIRPGLEP